MSNLKNLLCFVPPTVDFPSVQFTTDDEPKTFDNFTYVPWSNNCKALYDKSGIVYFLDQY